MNRYVEKVFGIIMLPIVLTVGMLFTLWLIVTLYIMGLVIPSDNHGERKKEKKKDDSRQH